MDKSSYNVAVVGATGAVGAEMIKVLEETEFPVGRLIALASERSIGKSVCFKGSDVPVYILEKNSFDGVDIALFSAGGAISLEYAPIAARAGAIVIDNSSTFRQDPDVPLIVPEINPDDMPLYSRRGIIANPNCSTIQMVMCLAPLCEIAHIKRVVVSTYQSVSGAGIEAMEELSKQTVAMFTSKESSVSVFPHRIAFNCIPHIDVFMEDGSTKEETKMVLETVKILGDESIKVAATTVRVPVFCGHSEAVNVEFDSPISVEQARAALSKAAGVEVIDEPRLCKYPTPLDCVGKDSVFVGRLRKDNSVENGLAMWIVSDNLRKGAALNAVQIARLLIEEYI